jgi:GTP-binding protein Era
VSEPFRAGSVAVVGYPNVGKSTLTNRLLGAKISIVTAKPQTTRHRVLGIVTRETHQMILMDTPGLLATAPHALDAAMMNAVAEALAGADALCVVVEPEPGLLGGPARLGERVRAAGRPAVLAINKVDTVSHKASLLPLIEEAAASFSWASVVPVSALRGDGVEALEAECAKLLPESPPLYPPDEISDRPERFFVAEIIRGRIFLRYGEEVPYATAVEIAEFSERPGRKDYVKAVVWVEKESQKGILIGRAGAALKRVGVEARREVEEFLGRPVFLDLVVDVRPKWRREEDFVRRMGYS